MIRISSFIALLLVILLSSCIEPVPNDPPVSDPVEGAGTGLLASYFDSASGERLLVRTDERIGFELENGEAPGFDVPQDHFSVVWTGELEAPETGEYSFSAFADDGVRVMIGSAQVLEADAWTRWAFGQPAEERLFSGSTIELEAGERVPIHVEYFEWDWGAELELSWTRPDGTSEPIPTRFLYPADVAETQMPADVPIPESVPVAEPPEGPTEPSEPSPTEPYEPIPADEAASRTYVYDESDFLNPERGFHRWADLTRPATLSGKRGEGVSLVRAYVRLDDYRNSDLPGSLLDALDASFETARDQGVKVIIRFSYNFGYEADASESRILGHIEQLAPVLERNGDVIAVVQTGFVGAWGEWHSSTNGLTSNTSESRAARGRIIRSLLDAVPESRMIQIRYPKPISEQYPQPVSYENRFDGSDQSRVGHKNDCFLRNPTDSGTYSYNAYPPGVDYSYYEPWRTYAEELSEHTVYGGETCADTGTDWSARHRLSCDQAVPEMESLNVDYLNIDFDVPSIEIWRNEGCFDEIDRRMGYRFYLRNASISETVEAGSNGGIELNIENRGFGKMYNPRPIDVVLRSASSDAMIRLTYDARRDLPLGGEVASVSYGFTVPASLEPGDYRVLLSMPDAEPRLASTDRMRTFYSVRLASTANGQSLWTPGGYNDLGLTLSVT